MMGDDWPANWDVPVSSDQRRHASVLPARHGRLAVRAGYLLTGAGLFEAAPGHLSTSDDVAVRLADAMRRGALCRDTTAAPTASTSSASTRSSSALDLREVRRLLPPAQIASALDAGSVGPWEPGGISPFQLDSGQRLASDEHRPYSPYGAAPA